MKNKKQFNPSLKVRILYLLLFSITSYAFSQDSNQTESPYFQVNCTDTNNVGFPLISTKVDATISGVIASVEIEQTYLNIGDSALEAVYVFPMSTNAAVYGMQMVIGERVIDAVIKEKAEAQEIFETARDSGLTTTLLEQHRPNVFQMNIANIHSNDTVKVRMKYVELMEPEGGVYQFVFPTIVGPRFTFNNEEWVIRTSIDSLDVSKSELIIDLNINAGMDVVATCNSHNANIQNNGQNSSCYIETNPAKDFIVDYTMNGNEIETGLLLYEGEQENFFLAMLQPPKPEVEFKCPKREYVFIMDISGSMTGTPIEISKEMITNLLNDLNIQDKFNIVFFAGGSAVLSANSLEATQENIESAISMIDEINAGGHTDLLPAMEMALAMEGTANYSRTFVILTDGYVTVEKEAFELIRERLNDANFFSFGIGSSINREIIEGIAYVGQGESFVVTEPNNAGEMANTFKEYIESPVLTNINTSFNGISLYDIEPLSIPDVFAERPILIYGKYDDADNGILTVTGDYADGQITESLNFADHNDNNDENIALMYLWARKRIKLMSDYGIASNENDTLSIEEEVTQLGLQYNLVTEYTSFVAVDSAAFTNVEEQNDQYNDDEMFATDMYDRNARYKNDIIQILNSNVVDEASLNISLINTENINCNDLRLKVVDMTGKVVINKKVSALDVDVVIKLNLGELQSGFYLITLVSANEIMDSERFVITK